MMFKVKVRVDVIRGNYSKGEEVETMMDSDTFRIVHQVAKAEKQLRLHGVIPCFQERIK